MTAIPEGMQMPCEVYIRVVGYYRPKAQCNAGKQAEISERKQYFIKSEAQCQQT